MIPAAPFPGRDRLVLPRQAMLSAVLLVILLTGAHHARADTPNTGFPGASTVPAACPSELTPFDLEQARLLEATGIYRETPPGRDTGVFLVYMAFHVVRESGGTGGIPQSQLDQAMVDLAAAFEGTLICFTVAYQDTIDSSTYYNLDSSVERQALKAINNQPHMIDCYFVNDDNGACGASSFSWATVQGITFTNSCIGLPTNPSTFPHEVGHYFNLYHTHETALGLECPSGSNCDTAGDLLCDTPADPDLAGQVDTGCLYTGDDITICDLEVHEYDPDCSNMMSYSLKTCRTQFTWDQKARMLNTLVLERWGEEGFDAPDFLPVTPEGWTGSIVPRRSDGGTPEDCLVTSTLVGNAESTRLNIAFSQANPEAHDSGVEGRVHLDEELVHSFAYPPGTFSGIRYLNDLGPIEVRGGRHTLHLELEPVTGHCESNDANNWIQAQYVWIPYPLGHGESLIRQAPPGSHAGSAVYPNCDGFGFTRSGWWSAVSILPLSGSADYGLRLHNDYGGSTEGFATYLAESDAGPGEPDWVIVNHNTAPYGENWQAGVNNRHEGTAGFLLNKAESVIEELDDGKRICGVLEADRILDIFEMHFLPEAIDHSWKLTLTSRDDVDLDLYVYAADGEYFGRDDDLASSRTAGTSNETLFLGDAELTTAGFYGIAVARHGMASLDVACDWDIRFEITSPALAVHPPEPPRFLVVQDQEPFGSTEWTDRLAAHGIPYTIIPTDELAGVDLDPYHAVIVPSPMSPASHIHVQASRDKLETYNDRGGIVVQGTSTVVESGGFDTVGGLEAEWQPCSTVLPSDHLLVTGVAGESVASPAVRHVFPVLIPGWISLATSGCGDLSPCMAVNEDRGLLVYGCPLELSLSQADCSLGESIENIVGWALDRAERTIRLFGQPGDPPFEVTLDFTKSIYVACTYAHSGFPGWIDIDPVGDTMYPLDASDPVVYTVDPVGLGTGTHFAMIELEHDLYGSPRTLLVYMTLRPRSPRAPLELAMTPMDFTSGHATVHVSWEPVTEDVEGHPITVDSYSVYIDEDPYMGSPVILSTASTGLTIDFHGLGMTTMGFLRVVALSGDGTVAGDSRPGERDD